MRLGLNLGLTKQGAAAVVAPADWANWDGTNDGAVTNLQTVGARGVAGVACISSTKALIAYTKEASDTGDLQCIIATRDGDTITENGNVDVTASQDIRQKPSLCRLSDTRALIAYINDTVAVDIGDIVLIIDDANTDGVINHLYERHTASLSSRDLGTYSGYLATDRWNDLGIKPITSTPTQAFGILSFI